MAKLETLVRSERTVNTTWRLLLHAGKAGWFRVSREMRMGEGDRKAGRNAVTYRYFVKMRHFQWRNQPPKWTGLQGD
jgi:hypothetical protein